MSLIYKTCTSGGQIPTYNCNACGETEGGRVRGAAYIHKSLKSALTSANLLSIAWWEQQIEAGLIFVIPSTRGTFDGGTANTVTGFGDETNKKTGKTYVAVINDANHAGNQAFYQALENNFADYILAFRTEKELRVANEVLTDFNMQDAVTENTEDPVLWAATATWVQKIPNTLVEVLTLTDDIKELFSKCIDTEASADA
ncbi:MAG: hypothetical protein LBR64_10755 [Dysgonamonadaceae bacterium]|jgi:hypothetical protein|nr:hypothetical protein [Dysgonamonadaceae bacterium]